MANSPKPPNLNDISDVKPSGANTPNTSPTQLPIRGEKRILPTPVNPDQMSSVFNAEWSASGQDSPQEAGYPGNRSKLVELSDFYVVGALKPYVDYVSIRVQNRGVNAQGVSDPSQSAVYRFLINPNQVSINRTMLDAQAFARAGWQFGVWGEDMVQINISGKTAGQYFAFGNTDTYLPYSQSYRNLEMLQVVFENNGYWFEGEQAAEGPLAADFARRRIKMQQDVQLIVGNFMWNGMFETLQITQSADAPFLMNFTLSFIAWKERYRPGSPYQDTIHNDIQRGNAYSVYQSTQQTTSLQALSAILPPTNPVMPLLAQQPPPNVNPNTPAVVAASVNATAPTVDPTVMDVVPATIPVPGTNVTLTMAAGPTPTSQMNPPQPPQTAGGG